MDIVLTEIISPCGNYKAQMIKDPDGEQVAWKTGDTERLEDKYIVYKIIRTKDNQLINTYKQFRSLADPHNHFYTIKDTVWWFGGTHYMAKLFINCQTGEMFDDPNNIKDTDGYKDGYEFIWCKCVFSPDNNFMLVYGCIWAFPNEWRLYDISSLEKDGKYQCVSMYDKTKFEDDMIDYYDQTYRFKNNDEIEIVDHKGTILETFIFKS